MKFDTAMLCCTFDCSATSLPARTGLCRRLKIALKQSRLQHHPIVTIGFGCNSLSKKALDVQLNLGNRIDGLDAPRSALVQIDSCYHLQYSSSHWLQLLRQVRA